MGMEIMDKILEDSIPCRVRAKRGFATHPRSIAERVGIFIFISFMYLNLMQIRNKVGIF